MQILGDSRVSRDSGLKKKSFVIPKAVFRPEEPAFAWSLNERGVGVTS
jgi:hypothetical protein